MLSSFFGIAVCWDEELYKYRGFRFVLLLDTSHCRGSVPPKCCSVHSSSLGPCSTLAAARGITAPSLSLQLPGLMVRKSVRAARQEMDQLLQVAGGTPSFRHSPKCAFCSACSVPPPSRCASLAAAGGNGVAARSEREN